MTFGATTTTGNATFNVGANALVTLGALSDGGSADSITKSGTGTLTLGSAAGTITNGTALAITAGTVNSSNATALGTLAAVTLSTGATLNLGASQTLGSIAGTGGTLNLNANTLTVGSTNNLSGSYGGSITGTGNLVKAGTGTLTLTSGSSYSGTTTVNAGTLNLQSGTALGSGSSTVTVGSGATLQLQGGITVARNLSLGGTLESVSGANLLSGNITLTGAATINSNTAATEFGVGKTDFTSIITMGANTLTVGGAGDLRFNSFVGQSGDTGGFIKTGSGTVTFYGDRNYYTGTTDVRDGTLILDTLDDIYMPDVTILGDLIIGDGTGSAGSAVVRFGNVASANNKIANTSNVTINADGTLDLNSRADRINAVTFTGGSITLGSTGTLTLFGDVTTNASSQTATISGYQFALSDSASTIRTFT
ncbi:MAG: autotransporter-associated beta strand repeat-containing protein, partial [Candidatus Didemnitutus sp.]|nr:autotransporter-associated beta strand repeat-containing protein [Candidatus Didemnitutus sp.]